MMLEISIEITQALFHLFIFIFFMRETENFHKLKNACLCGHKTGASDFRLCLGIDMLLATLSWCFLSGKVISLCTFQNSSFLYEGN